MRVGMVMVSILWLIALSLLPTGEARDGFHLLPRFYDLTVFGSDGELTLEAIFSNNATTDLQLVNSWEVVRAGQEDWFSLETLSFPLYIQVMDNGVPGQQEGNIFINVENVRIGEYYQVVHVESFFDDVVSDHYMPINITVPADIFVTPITDEVVTEGDFRTVTFVLGNKPSVEDTIVTIDITLENATALAGFLSVDNGASDAGSPVTFIFSDSTWNLPQTVTFQTYDDGLDSGDRSIDIRYEITTSDPAYQAYLDTHEVVSNSHILIEEDDISGIVTSIDVVEITEGDAGVVIDYTMLSEPYSDVTITLPTSEYWEADPTTYTWTASNWDTVLEVVLASVDDVVVEGKFSEVIEFSGHLTSSDDPAYDGIQLPPINITVLDNDIAPTGISPTFGYTGLEGQYIDIEFPNEITFNPAIGYYPAHVECRFGDDELFPEIDGAFGRVNGKVLSSRLVRCPIPDCTSAQSLGRVNQPVGACYSPVEVFLLVSAAGGSYNDSISTKQVSLSQGEDSAMLFYFVDYPEVTSVEPRTGDIYANTPITVHGNNLYHNPVADVLQPSCIVGGQISAVAEYYLNPKAFDSDPDVYSILCEAPPRGEYLDAVDPEYVSVEVTLNGQQLTNDRIEFGYIDEAKIRAQDAWLLFYMIFYVLVLLMIMAWTRHFFLECCKGDRQEVERPPQTGPLLLIRAIDARIEARRAENAEQGMDEDGDPLTEETIDWYVSEADMSLRQKKAYKTLLMDQLKAHNAKLKEAEKRAIELKEKRIAREKAMNKTKLVARGDIAHDHISEGDEAAYREQGGDIELKTFADNSEPLESKHAMEGLEDMPSPRAAQDDQKKSKKKKKKKKKKKRRD